VSQPVSLGRRHGRVSWSAVVRPASEAGPSLPRSPRAGQAGPARPHFALVTLSACTQSSPRPSLSTTTIYII
jgi:hypothetical protein